LSRIKNVLSKLTGWQWFNAISILLIVTALWGVVVGNSSFSALFGRWGSLRLGWMITAFLCMIGYWLMESIELHWLVRCLYEGVPFFADARTAMIGQLYSALTPFASGGQPVQLVYMKRDGLDTGGAASVLVIKSIIYQLGIMLMALLPLLTSYHLFRSGVAAFGWLAMLGFGTNLFATVSMLLLALYPRAAAGHGVLAAADAPGHGDPVFHGDQACRLAVN